MFWLGWMNMPFDVFDSTVNGKYYVINHNSVFLVGMNTTLMTDTGLESQIHAVSANMILWVYVGFWW